MIPNGHTMIWAEVYSGIPGRPRTKCLAYGWCACPKWNTDMQAMDRVRASLHNQYPSLKNCILTYPADRCGKKFRVSDPFIGVFG